MILLRPTSTFSSNGVLRGTIVAFDEDEEPLGWEQYGNWSIATFRQKAAKDLAATFDMGQDRASVLITRAVQEARRDTDQAVDASPSQRARSLPSVQVNDRQLRDIVDDCWDLLRQRNEDSVRYFRFGDVLTDLQRQVNRDGDGEVHPRTVTVPSLRMHLARAGDFIRTKDGDDRAAAPPKDVLESMLALVDEDMPQLMGVTHSPIVFGRCEIVSESGYHPPTGMFLDVGGLRIPTISDAPTEREIGQARRIILDDYLGDFPFVGDSDRAHAVCANLNHLLRLVIAGSTPLFMNEAPVQGSGKGLLASTVALIATGKAPAIMTEASSDEEWRKRITAKLLRTPPVTLIDNITRRLDSGALSAVLTSLVWEDRFLGMSRTVTVPVTTTWLATANNPTYSGEMARRVVRIRIDAATEKPWERSGFRHSDLRAWVIENRPQLLWALFTIIRAWSATGSPAGTQVMGSFEQWAEVMGGVLDVAGIPGFLGNRNEVYAQAETLGEVWRTLLDLWWQEYKDQRVGVDQLFTLAKDNHLLTDLREGRTDRGARTSVGMALAGIRDRIIGLYRIRDAGSGHGGAASYRLELKEGAEKVHQVHQVHQPLQADGGEGGEPFSDPMRDPWDKSGEGT